MHGHTNIKSSWSGYRNINVLLNAQKKNNGLLCFEPVRALLNPSLTTGLHHASQEENSQHEGSLIIKLTITSCVDFNTLTFASIFLTIA